MTTKKDAVAKRLANDPTLRGRTIKVLDSATHLPQYTMAARLMGVTNTDLSFGELVETCNQIMAAAENYARIANMGVESGLTVEIEIDGKQITGEVTSIEMGGLVVVKPRSKNPVTITPSKWDSVKVFTAA